MPRRAVGINPAQRQLQILFHKCAGAQFVEPLFNELPVIHCD